MTLRYPMASALALLCAVGCVPGQSADGGGGADGGPTLPDGAMPEPVDALAARAGLICELLMSCDAPPGFDSALARFARRAPEGCPAYMRALLGSVGGDDAPPTRWSPEAFEACRAGALTTCHPIDAIPACRAALAGDGAPGEPCDERAGGCVVDAYCDVPLGQPECDFVCIAGRAAGEPCDFDAQCALGPALDGHCAMGPDGGTCAPLALQGGAAVGQPCGRIVDGGHRLVGCALGGWCDVEAGVCRPTLAVGDACAPDGAPCQVGDCDGLGRCDAPAITEEVGAACADRDLPRCNPFAGLGCDFESGVCVPSAGRQGQPCGFAGGAICREGLYCRGATCEPTVPPGGDCDPGDEYDPCAGGECVHVDGPPSEGVCLPLDDGGDVCPP